MVTEKAHHEDLPEQPGMDRTKSLKAEAKLKRSAESTSLALDPNPDILAAIGAARPPGQLPVLVGFAVETDTDERVVAEARRKLAAKQVDIIVANHASDSFGKDDNRATIVTPTSADALCFLPKTELADRILDRALPAYRR